MSELATEQVTDERGDAGAMVWCPNGHGNRILDVGERIGFPCPQCTEPMSAEQPEAYVVKTKPVELPDVGRIVMVRTSHEHIRPAIVAGRTEEGVCYLHIQFVPNDPRPPGLYSGEGWCGYSETRIGGWFWPVRTRQKVTFETPVADENVADD